MTGAGGFNCGDNLEGGRGSDPSKMMKSARSGQALRLASAVILAGLVAPLVQHASAATLTIELTGKLTTDGPVKVSLWRDEATFLKGKAFKVASVAHKDGTTSAIFTDVAPGTYAVSAYHDKNGNGRLDSGFMGKPSEPYGFSNDARGTFGPAKFTAAKFELREPGQKLTIHLK